MGWKGIKFSKLYKQTKPLELIHEFSKARGQVKKQKPKLFLHYIYIYSLYIYKLHPKKTNNLI
jgi:hypothetical protein